MDYQKMIIDTTMYRIYLLMCYKNIAFYSTHKKIYFNYI